MHISYVIPESLVADAPALLPVRMLADHPQKKPLQERRVLAEKW